MNRKNSVLIIDDEEAIRRILENELSSYGFEVYVAENAFDGLELAKTSQPDLILLDWMMPEIDGLETLSKLKREKATKCIPVLMLTAKNKVSDIEKAYRRGADDYITKPFQASQVAKTVTRKLENLSKKKRNQPVGLRTN